FESFILVRIMGERFAGWKRASVPLSGWFGVIGIAQLTIGSLLQAALSAVIRSPSAPRPGYDLALAWYIWGSHALYAFAAWLRASKASLESGADESQLEQSERSEGSSTDGSRRSP